MEGEEANSRQVGQRSGVRGVQKGRAGAVLKVVRTLARSHRSVTTGHGDALRETQQKKTRPHTHLHRELTTMWFPGAKRRNNPNVHH